jgi:hypothetical protein
VQGWIAILYAAIVTGTDERSVFIENGGANRNAAFGESLAGFGDGDKQHRAEMQRVRHGQKYTRLCFGGVREVIAYVEILPVSAGKETLRMTRLEGSAVREADFRKRFCAGAEKNEWGENGVLFVAQDGRANSRNVEIDE